MDDDEKVIGKLSGYRLSLHDCWMDYYYFEEAILTTWDIMEEKFGLMMIWVRRK